MKHLVDNRSFLMVVLLTIITFGIYGFYLIHVMARDTNVACEGDGKNTAGLLKVILFSVVTFGIYSIIWQFKIISRWATYVAAHGDNPECTIILLVICNIVLSGTMIAPLIFSYKYLKGFNQVCMIYNERPRRSSPFAL